jgi:putative endonuclease
LKKYYVGSTSNAVEVRLDQHNLSFYGNKKFTHTTTDWQIFLSIECGSREQAASIERHIKSMKSSKYIQNLKKYPEMITKLMERYTKNNQRVPGSSR